ncbi:MAG: sialic acid-specific 9-O-acetylesterase [Pedosphaera sp.]|nr:sialic acid-specific 9-O-acetylesterase [Pedosphaera sp.]
MKKALGLLLGLGLGGYACATVTPHGLFTDNAVIQQAQRVPIWGTASEGEKVTVELAGQKATTTAKQGRWLVHLDDLKAGGPFTLTITGDNTIKVNNVLVGDVWLCSGQSNMEFGLAGAHNAREELPRASQPDIRIFLVARAAAFEPQDAPGDTAGLNPSDGLSNESHGHWLVCTPENVLKATGWTAFPGFSAVAYFFGREIQRTTHQPVGLIGSYYGGTLIQAWTSLDALKRDPAFDGYIRTYEAARAKASKIREKFPEARKRYDLELAQWRQEAGDPFAQATREWEKTAGVASPPLSPRPKPSRPAPIMPPTGDPGKNTASVLFNAMIRPLIPYGIKGVIWYQGESNAATPHDYEKLFQCLITDWRSRWAAGDFPFLFVQLAAFVPPPKSPATGNWALIREAQSKALLLPRTAMAVTIDLGAGKNIHPQDKADVGHRLALAARRMAYGEDLVFSGPACAAMTLEDGKIRLTFKHAGHGLQAGAPPWTADGTKPAAPTELSGFAIAGDDQKWIQARAIIDGDTVVVSSDEVAHPVAVRYGWADNPSCNLYNQEGLPASPFRTDAWPLPENPDVVATH